MPSGGVTGDVRLAVGRPIGGCRRRVVVVGGRPDGKIRGDPGAAHGTPIVEVGEALVADTRVPAGQYAPGKE